MDTYKGFLQTNDEGVWILCDAPNLKSCCIKKHAIVTLNGDFSRYSKEKAVTATGTYENGTLSSVTIKERNSPFPYWSIGAIVLIFCIFKALKGLKRRLPLP